MCTKGNVSKDDIDAVKSRKDGAGLVYEYENSRWALEDGKSRRSHERGKCVLTRFRRWGPCNFPIPLPSCYGEVCHAASHRAASSCPLLPIGASNRLFRAKVKGSIKVLGQVDIGEHQIERWICKRHDAEDTLTRPIRTDGPWQLCTPSKGYNRSEHYYSRSTTAPSSSSGPSQQAQSQWSDSHTHPWSIRRETLARGRGRREYPATTEKYGYLQYGFRI